MAIAHDPVPLVVVAGAGSGKTAIMAARMVWLVEEGIGRPAQILGLTFTNKAARELEQRIAAAFAEFDPHPQEEPYIATYNSFADRLVREHGVRIGIDPDVGLLSEAQRWQLLLNEFDHLPAFDAVESRSTASILRSVLSLADQCANHLVTPERIIDEDERILDDGERFNDEVIVASRRRIELARVVRAYIDAKERAGRIDFGDQVVRAVEVLEKFPDLAAELRERYPAILLDEYQDTNVAQRRMMQSLAPEAHNITAVGDARQNIFQWRGSTLYNLIDFPTKHFLREGGVDHEHLSLSENYRCGSRILGVANRIIEASPPDRRPGLPLRPHPANGEGGVFVKLLADQRDEAEFIAEEISALHGSSIGEGRDPAEWRDFAILVRRKAHISGLYDALTSRHIPVEVVGLGGLLQVPEIMDSVAWLRVMADPGPPANRWLARLLIGPRFRVHYRDLKLLADWAVKHTTALSKEKQLLAAGEPAVIVPKETEFEPDDVAYSLGEALDHLDEIEGLGPVARSRLGRAASELADLRAAAGGPLLDVVQRVIATSGIGEAADARGADASASRANLTNFLGVVASFAPIIGEPSLGAFLAYLDAAEDVEETLDPATPAAGDSVKLMTVHQAKGLEFEVVFVPGVASGESGKGEKVYSIFPDSRVSNPLTSYAQLPYSVREDAEHLPSPWAGDGKPKKKGKFLEELKERAIEDERRLFYVALTRAKQRVYVTAAWWYERQKRPHGSSLFFDETGEAPETEVLSAAEMPEESPMVARMATRAVWPPEPPHSLRPDSLWPEGYPELLTLLQAGEVSAEEVLGRLDPGVRSRAEEILAEHRAAIEALERARRETDSAREALPSSLSATQAVSLASGTLRPADLSRPLPERPSAARRIGTEIHRWIEERALGLTGLADEEALDVPSAHVERSRIDELKGAFEGSEFARRKFALLDGREPMSELRFVLKVGGRLVRGRIDAVYLTEDGGMEIVDFKSGAEVEVPDVDQLRLYAAALSKLGADIRWPLKLTYFYLATGKTSPSVTIGPEEAQQVLDQLSESLPV